MTRSINDDIEALVTGIVSEIDTSSNFMPKRPEA
jgi:hypothetical protein